MLHMYWEKWSRDMKTALSSNKKVINFKNASKKFQTVIHLRILATKALHSAS